MGLGVFFFAAGAFGGPLFPYQGRLDRDGKPVSGVYQLQFSLYPAASGGSPVWGPELFPSVQVVAGAFSVKLGSVTAIDPRILVNGPLYIQVAVEGPNDTSFTSLAGRQQLLHTPYASASQQDFLVAGKLAAGGATTDGGTTVTLNGPTSDGVTVGVLELSSPSGKLIADGQFIDSTGSLMLNTRSGHDVSVGGSLQVAVNVSTTGSVFAGGALHSQYNSNWFPVTDQSGEVVKAHGLNQLPSWVSVQQCGLAPTVDGSVGGAIDLVNGQCPTRVIVSTGPGGYKDPGIDLNPSIISMDNTNIYLEFVKNWWVFAYWTNALGWGCSPSTNCFSGYYRVLGWK